MIGPIENRRHLEARRPYADRHHPVEERPEEAGILSEDEIEQLVANISEMPAPPMEGDRFSEELERDGSAPVEDRPNPGRSPFDKHPMDAAKSYAEVVASETGEADLPPTVSVPL